MSDHDRNHCENYVYFYRDLFALHASFVVNRRNLAGFWRRRIFSDCAAGDTVCPAILRSSFLHTDSHSDHSHGKLKQKLSRCRGFVCCNSLDSIVDPGKKSWNLCSRIAPAFQKIATYQGKKLSPPQCILKSAQGYIWWQAFAGKKRESLRRRRRLQNITTYTWLGCSRHRTTNFQPRAENELIGPLNTKMVPNSPSFTFFFFSFLSASMTIPTLRILPVAIHPPIQTHRQHTHTHTHTHTRQPTIRKSFRTRMHPRPS